jgi:hypothetical protein
MRLSTGKIARMLWADCRGSQLQLMSWLVIPCGVRTGKTGFDGKGRVLAVKRCNGRKEFVTRKLWTKPYARRKNALSGDSGFQGAMLFRLLPLGFVVCFR